ncbi:MAG: hypothetical protein ACLQMH_03965 [Solirubrobacteraceae bacterium]
MSDGTRYVAWEKSSGSPITVFDSRTGSHRQITPPAGCALREYAYSEGLELRGQGAAGRFLLDCGKSGYALLEASTGHITALPTVEGAWRTVGSLYVEGSSADHDACSHSEAELRESMNPWCAALYEIATATVSYRPEDSWGAQLDRSGAPPICARFRQKVLAERTGEEEEQAYADGLYVHASRNGHDVKIERCKGASITLRGQGTPRDFDLRGGVLTWDTGHPGGESESEPKDAAGLQRGMLFSYDPATRKRRSWILPRLSLLSDSEGATVHGVFGYSTHTTTMVFWLATRHRECVVSGEGYQPVCTHPEVFSVYAARMNHR